MDQPLPSICGLHPGVAVTGFCPACLRERLAGLHSPSSSASHPNSTELRRCKSFSYGRSGAAYLEPQRRSYDARGALFHQEPPCVPEEVEQQIGGFGSTGTPMKEHISQESSSSRKMAGTFGVLGKRWQEWRRKNKLKKQGQGPATSRAAMPPPENPRWHEHHSFGDAQSEVAVDALGRRSYDVEPRLSLDAGRISVDAPKYSLVDEPRASWDGYHGCRPVLARLPPMLSVVEDVPIPRYDGQIHVEEDDEAVPGGSSQTRDYYLDSSSSGRRRRSLDRSSASGRRSFSDANELPRMTAGANANARVSPAIGAEFYHYHHAQSVLGHHQHWEQQGPYSLRDDSSVSFEPAFRDHTKGAPAKKSKNWIKGWNIWGLIQKKSGARESEADRSFSESWPELRARGQHNGQMLRRNSSVSARSSFGAGGAAIGLSGRRRSNVEMHANGLGRMRRDEVLLERTLSARYSLCRVDNGMIPPHLNPVGGGQFSRRSHSGISGTGRPARPSNSLPRSTLGLY